MGNEPSQIHHFTFEYKPLFDDSHVKPVIMSSQSTKHKTSLIKAPYFGTWSISYPNSLVSNSRAGHSYIYDKEKDRIIICYGYSCKNTYLNDIWEYNLGNKTWNELNVKLLSPREYASATLIGRKMFIFGGKNETQYFNELLMVDIDSYQSMIIELKGTLPRERCNSVIFAEPNALYLFGGHSGEKTHHAVHVLRGGNTEWHRYEGKHLGRARPCFCTHNNVHYVFGSCKNSGLITFESHKKQFNHIHYTGVEPPHDIENASLVGVDEYLFLVGGRSENNYMHLYALDIKRRWWFVFHVRPDMVTVGLNDGHIGKYGLYQLPREHSATTIYRKESRELISVLGSRMLDPPPTVSISLGSSLAILHPRSDMFEMLRRFIPDEAD